MTIYTGPYIYIVDQEYILASHRAAVTLRSIIETTYAHVHIRMFSNSDTRSDHTGQLPVLVGRGRRRACSICRSSMVHGK
eukprot:scaffold338458_cov17-Prasinocladus_malaysianus.AAC.1